MPSPAPRALPGESALRHHDDPREVQHRLSSLHTMWADTGELGAGLRPLIARSWARQRPAAGRRRMLSDEELAQRREASRLLPAALEVLRDSLLSSCLDSANELVICDHEGFVLESLGPRPVLRRSEQLGFVPGACWSESAVGTNALGTALVERRAVQVFGAEHSHADQHGWVCTGAPILDAAGRALGAITLSGGLRTAHPHTTALVATAASLVGTRLQDAVRAELIELREEASALLDAQPGIVLTQDCDVVMAKGFQIGAQVHLPGGLREGTLWEPELGHFTARRSGSLWLLRPGGRPARALDLSSRHRTATLMDEAGEPVTVPLTPRQCELLSHLASHPEGLSARDLASLLYGRPDATVTVRAELARVRKRLGSVVDARPYRITVPVRLS